MNRRHLLMGVAGVGFCSLAASACSRTGGSHRKALAGQTAQADPLLHHASKYLERLETYGFSGAVSVVYEDGSSFVSAHGQADREKNVAWSADSIFDTGSVAKQFTAAAILALEADGKLRTTDTVSSHIPSAPGDKASITLHQLLTHTAGFTDAVGEDYERINRDAFVSRVMEAPLEREPGERFDYSNAGYALLAAIAEIVSGQSFDRFLRERLFTPAGMQASGYTIAPQHVHLEAQGYRNDKNERLTEQAHTSAGEIWNLIGNGGLFSTLADLRRWVLALTSDVVLPPAARSRLFHPHVEIVADYAGSGSALHYGYGWNVWVQPSGKRLIWHLGGNGGVLNAAIRYHVDEGRTVIYGANVPEFHDPAYPVPAIERTLEGKPVALPPETRPLPEALLSEFTGTYALPSGERLQFKMERGFLRAVPEGQGAYAFVLTGRWRAPAEFAILNKLTEQAVELSRVGDLGALAPLFDLGATAEEIAAFEASFWQRRHEAFGQHVRTRMLGTSGLTGKRFVGRSVVALDFERGTVWREYFWTEGHKISDLGPVDEPPSLRFHHIGDGAFAAVDAPSGRLSQIRFDPGDGQIDLIIADAPVLRRQS